MKELRRYLNEFSAYCQSQGINSAEELTPSFLKAYADQRCMDDKPTLKKAVVWSLRKFGKHLALLQVLNKDPAQNLRHPKFHPRSELPEYLTKKELRRLLEYSALELVRYIHLNPVRAGVVKSLGKLDLWWFETKRRWPGRCFGRNWPGISVYPDLQSRRPSSEVKNLQKRMMLNY